MHKHRLFRSHGPLQRLMGGLLGGLRATVTRECTAMLLVVVPSYRQSVKAGMKNRMTARPSEQPSNKRSLEKAQLE